MRTNALLAVTSGFFVCVGVVNADTVRGTYRFVPFTAEHTGPGQGAEAGLAGEAMTMELLEVSGFPQRVAFRFAWSGAALGAVGAMYWDDESGTLGSMFSITDSDGAGTGVSYSNAGGNVPAGNTINFSADFGAARTTGPGGIARSLDALGEWARFDFDLTGSNTYLDVKDALTTAFTNPFADTAGGLRVALHIQSIGAGSFSESFVVVPLPDATWAGMTALAGLGGIGYLRRRSFKG